MKTLLVETMKFIQSKGKNTNHESDMQIVLWKPLNMPLRILKKNPNILYILKRMRTRDTKKNLEEILHSIIVPQEWTRVDSRRGLLCCFTSTNKGDQT